MFCEQNVQNVVKSSANFKTTVANSACKYFGRGNRYDNIDELMVFIILFINLGLVYMHFKLLELFDCCRNRDFFALKFIFEAKKN